MRAATSNGALRRRRERRNSPLTPFRRPLRYVWGLLENAVDAHNGVSKMVAEL